MSESALLLRALNAAPPGNIPLVVVVVVFLPRPKYKVEDLEVDLNRKISG